ncbi:hypothetical protein TNCT_311061 [Trichonephila clavata]|uniref:Uncharacterized protein n=1 Tax=Trichonephila clavata TaxID=2740835 RepID=A0A8X6J1J6_TRICU|nr:hypothetical protein TNCT_311061 [Trichonephila clavata]
MLQSLNCHAKRLRYEKIEDEKVKKAKENLDIITRSIQLELSEIEKVFAAAVLLINSRVEEDMDLDMDENAEECSNEDQTENDELYQLRESNDTLKQN